jgi:hypothetical protein
MASADTVTAFENLTRIGSERDICVCPAHRNLEIVQDTLHRRAMLDQWAPVASFDTGNDVCPLCMDTISSTTTVRVSLCVCVFSAQNSRFDADSADQMPRQSHFLWGVH